MNKELMTTQDIADLYGCGRERARDVITKLVGFPEIAPGSTTRNPRWLRIEVKAFLQRKPAKSRQNPASLSLHQ